MSTTLKVLSAKKVIANYQINQGEQLIIEARAQSNYQLVDDKTGFAPDNIITKRDGKDLKIYLNDGDMSEDIIIKDYYGDEIGETTNLLVGKHENGSIYAYIPESGLQPDAVSLLADQAVAPQALGGEELVSAFWAFNPWWLLALAPLAAGIAIAAHDGGNNSGGGDLNTQADGAAKLVEDAEVKAKALDDKIKELEADGNISAEDKATLDALKADADAAKAKADEAMKGLPADNAAKEVLQGRVDAIDNRVPDVTPDPADGVIKLVGEAEAKAKALDDKIKELEADGNISAEDKATLDALKADADAAKAKADEAVKGLPADNAAKDGLQGRVDAIDNRVPDVTPDPADGATKLVEDAEAKAKALDDKIKELEADGNISAEDKATLDALKADADAAKAKADEAVKGLPADNAAKDGLQGRVDAIDNRVPDVTPDPADGATKLVEDAEAKAKALDDKIKELEADGNISAEDKATLDALKADADAAKAKADEAVKGLPADNAAKDGLQGRVDAIDNRVPDVTPDPADGATKLVEEAEAKAKALDDKIKELEADGNISAEDKATLDALKADADAAKAKADEAVKGLPADNAAKDGLQGRVDAIDNRVPDVTPDPADGATKLVEDAEAKAKALDDKIKELEADGNISAEDKATLDALKADADAAKTKADEAVKGLPADNAAKDALQGRVDAIDNRVPDVTPDPADGATKLVEEAEAKAKALDDKIKELEADGNISAEDKATLDALKADADAAKAKADEAVKGLPADNAAKDGLQGRVDAIDNRVPDVTPDPADGATKLVEDAEAKAKALDDKIKELEADGNISAEDKATLDALKADADAAKAKADEAVKGLPADNAAKDGLQGRVDAIDNRVPDVTPDPADGATKLVEEAEAKAKALDDKIKELEADGNISAEDKATLDALKADADAAKAKADEAVKGLPADNAAKDELQGRVDAIDNRVPDVTPDPVDGATKLVEDAEAKAKALDDRIKELEADGNISAEDKATLDALKADADAAKAKADEAVKGLPADNAAKDGLQGRVDAIDNRVPDVTPDPADGATKLVEEAEAKAKALDDKIKELEADGNISAEDKATLDALKADADAAKAKADEAVKGLPADNAAKDGLQGRVDAIDNRVPDVTPDPADGATKLVEEAEAKAKALDDKIKELEADGNISAEDKATLDALKADADAAKAKADEAVKGLPADNAAKDELQGRVDAIDNRVPDVTPDQTDSSNWGVDTDGWIENDSTADNPPDTDPSDESGEDNTPQLDPTVIVTGRTVLSNPTNAVMTKIRDKNPNVPTTQIQKVGSQAQFVTGEEDNTVVVGKGDKDNISGKNSITNGLIQTNGGSDKVVITNNSINTVIDTGADNDSVDIYGNLRHTGATAPESKIDTGNGDDVLTIRGRITGLKNQLMMGDGDDTVIVAGGATGNTTAQNNMQTKTNWNAIDLGEGNDKLSMGEKGPGNIQYTDIQAGIGDDVVILKPNRGKGDLLWVNVDLGDGNDSIVVAATDIRNVYISGGAGNDTIDLSASSTQTDATRSRVISSKVDGGEGNDHIILGKIDYVDDYPVDVTGGAGDDVITFTQDYAPFLTSNRIGASISGGDGFDTVAIKGTAMISLASGTAGTQKLPEGIINFESIDMTASGGQTVKLTASDVLANSGMLYIAGDSSDTVDLGNDGSSSLGGFTKTAETTARIALDGKEHTYTAYSNGDVKVYIDDQITNII